VELIVFAPIAPALKLPSVPHRELLEVLSPFDVLADTVATCAVPRPTGLGCYPSDYDDRLERHLDDAHAIEGTPIPDPVVTRVTVGDQRPTFSRTRRG